MGLAIGTKAPDFTLPTKTADGPKQITLSENFGKGNILLLFFPMAFTSTCTTEMCGVSSDLVAVRRNEGDRLWDQRRQPLCAGSLGAEGGDQRATVK